MKKLISTLILTAIMLIFALPMYASSYSRISENNPFGVIAVWSNDSADVPYYSFPYCDSLILQYLRGFYSLKLNKLVEYSISWNRPNVLPGGKFIHGTNVDTVFFHRLQQIDSFVMLNNEKNLSYIYTGSPGHRFITIDSAAIYDYWYCLAERYDGDGIGCIYNNCYIPEAGLDQNNNPLLINYWEISNEPEENPKWWTRCDLNNNDTLQDFGDYVEYVKISADAIHDANPNALVLAPTFLNPVNTKWDYKYGSYTIDPDSVWEVLLDIGGIDILTIHHQDDEVDNNIDTIICRFNQLENILSTNGNSKPVWNTEIGWRSSDYSYPELVDIYEQYLEYMRENDWLDKTFFFVLRYFGYNSSSCQYEYCNENLLDSNWNPYQHCTYLADYIERNTPYIHLQYPDSYNVFYANNNCGIYFNQVYDSFDSNSTAYLTDPTNIKVRIEYTTNFGYSWNLIADSVAVNEDGNGYYNWTIPEITSEYCKLRVSAVDPHHIEGNSTSDLYFTIRMSTFPTWIEPYKLVWNLQNNWSDNDQCDYVYEDSRGYIFACCQTELAEDQSCPSGIMILNSLGNIINDTIYQVSQFHRIRGIIEAEDIGDNQTYLVVGTDSITNLGGVIRIINENLNILGGVRIGLGYGEVQSVIKASDGNFVAVGSYQSKLWMGKFCIKDNSIRWIWKTTDLGMWGNIPGYLYHVVESNGKYVVVGSDRCAEQPGTIFLTVNTDGSGLYTETYPYGTTSCWASAYRIIKADSGAYIFVGQEKNPNPDSSQGATIWKVDSIGNIIWSQRYEKYSSPYFHSLNSVFIGDNGNIIVAGTGMDTLLNEELGFVATLNPSNGNIINISNPFGGLYNGDWDRSGMGKMNQTADGGFVVGGRISYTTPNWKRHTAISRFGYSGDLLNLDLGGSLSSLNYDMMLANSLFRDKSTIRFVLPRDCHVNVCVYNILGQKVKTLVNENRSAGTYELFWDGTDHHGVQVSSGSYFLRFNAGDFQTTKSLTVIR